MIFPKFLDFSRLEDIIFQEFSDCLITKNIDSKAPPLIANIMNIPNKYMGVDISQNNSRITIIPSQPKPNNIIVPGDISSATYWIIAACCHPNATIKINNVGINPTRSAILDILKSISDDKNLNGEILKNKIRPVIFVPESKTLEDLLTEILSKQTVSIPFHENLDDKELIYIVNQIKKFK